MDASRMVLLPLFNSAVLPLLVSLFTAGLLLRYWKGTFDWVPGLALFLGALAGIWAVAGNGFFQPVKISDWLPAIGLFGLLVGMMLAPLPRKFRPVIWILAILAVLWLLYRPLIVQWESKQTLHWFLVFCLPWLLSWTMLDWSQTADESPRVLLASIVTATGISLICVLDGSVFIGQLAGVLGSACGGLFLLTLKIRKLVIGPVFAAVYTLLAGSLLVNAYHYVEVSWLAIFFVWLSFFAISAVKLPFYQKRAIWQRAFMIVCLALVPTIAAVIHLLILAKSDAYY